MAKRSENEDAIPEMTEDVRNVADESKDDEFEETEDLDANEDDDREEGSF